MQVWEDTKAQEILKKQHFLGFFLNIVYTAFYAKVYKHSYNKTFQDFAENVMGCYLNKNLYIYRR